MSDIITLDCWVFGDILRIFPIDIPRTKTVRELKELIQKLAHIYMHGIRIYAIPKPSDDVLEKELEELTLQGMQPIDSEAKISDCFPASDGVNWLVIIDKIEITINYWMRGQPAKNILPTTTYKTSCIHELSQAIKGKHSKYFGDIDISALALYKVSIPFEEYTEETARNLSLDQDNFLMPAKVLSDVFPRIPYKDHVHVVVDVLPMSAPPSTLASKLSLNIGSRRLSFLARFTSAPPSSAADLNTFAKYQHHRQHICCNRPHYAQATIPPTLLHPVFGQFLDDCKSHEITADDSELELGLHIDMSGFHHVKERWARMLRKNLAEGGLQFNVTKINNKHETDGDMSVEGHRYAIAGIKKEISSKGEEPYHQTIFQYLEATRNSAVDLSTSPLPCIFIFFIGSHLSFAGATWNWCPVVQPLSVTLPMHCHNTDTDTRMMVIRHLGAFKKALHTLEKYYQDLTNGAPPEGSPDQTQLFPYCKHFNAIRDNEEQHFEYVSQPFDHQLVFFGKLDDNRPICIKFVRKYSVDAHVAFASLGYAPELHGSKELYGGWFMVVMDRLSEEEYIPLTDRDSKATVELVPNVRNAMQQVHDSGYLHGDLRDANIMVSTKDGSKFMLIDFEWSGKIGEVRYPMHVGRDPDEGLWRPDDAVDGAPILPEHDMAMLDDLEMRYRLIFRGARARRVYSDDSE